jgi:hypothetical protein
MNTDTDQIHPRELINVFDFDNEKERNVFKGLAKEYIEQKKKNKEKIWLQ